MAVMRNGILTQKFNAMVNESMSFMRLTEQLNRTASFLAAYKAITKGSDVFDPNAARKAAEFVYDSQFMVNSFNMPIGIKRLGPLGRTAMTLSMYPLHLLNSMFELGGGGKEGVKALMVIAGMAMMMGGAGALPFKDVLWAMFNKIFGIDMNLAIRRMGKDLGSEEAANVLLRGLPTLIGVDVANNLALGTPYVGGFINNKSALESATGAAGGVIKRFGTGMYDTITAPTAKKSAQAFVENIAPEFIAGPARALRQYDEGVKGKSGLPTLYQGKKIEYELTDVILAAIPMLGLKSSRMGELQEKRESIRNLEKMYRTAASDAQVYARETGSLKKIQEFNQAIIKHKLGGLIKPIKLAKPQKENKGKVMFEFNN